MSTSFHTYVPGILESECFTPELYFLLNNHVVVPMCITHLILLLSIVSLSLHSGEADVELLDDRRIQAVEVEQQHKLVIETCREMKGYY